MSPREQLAAARAIVEQARTADNPQTAAADAERKLSALPYIGKHRMAAAA